MHALVHDSVTCRASVPLRKVYSSQISFFGLVLAFPVTYFLFYANVVGVTDLGVSRHVFVRADLPNTGGVHSVHNQRVILERVMMFVPSFQSQTFCLGVFLCLILNRSTSH